MDFIIFFGILLSMFTSIVAFSSMVTVLFTNNGRNAQGVKLINRRVEIFLLIPFTILPFINVYIIWALLAKKKDHTFGEVIEKTKNYFFGKL